MIPTDDATLSRAVYAYLELRKTNKVRQVWMERGLIYMLPEGMPCFRHAAELILKENFIDLIDSLSPGVIITETPRKPVRSETYGFGNIWLRKAK